jgi:RNA polymerase sigma factor (sigma-70 family)
METRREVARALRSLPGRQREVLVLTYYLELSDQQIAQETGIRPTTVRSTRHRALAALGRVLKERS